MSCSLKDFLKAFAQEHALPGGGEVVLDISQDELLALGDFMLRGLCGWALSIETDRATPKLVEVTSSTDVVDDQYEQSNKIKSPIH